MRGAGAVPPRNGTYEGSYSGGFTVVVAEHAAEAIVAGDASFDASDCFIWLDEIVAESLMIALVVIMCFELGQSAAKRFLSEEDHSAEAF